MRHQTMNAQRRTQNAERTSMGCRLHALASREGLIVLHQYEGVTHWYALRGCLGALLVVDSARLTSITA